MANISFRNDVMPLFKQYKAPMIWRFDLTSYDDMKANAELICKRISGCGGPMPPPPFPPLSTEQIQMFKDWMKDGYLP